MQLWVKDKYSYIRNKKKILTSSTFSTCMSQVVDILSFGVQPKKSSAIGEEEKCKLMFRLMGSNQIHEQDM